MHFMNAEVAANTGGDHKSETLTGLTQSINKTDDLGDNELDEDVITTFTNAFSTAWDATA